MIFIIFHGSFSKIEEIWLPELKQKLEILGQKVLLPQFPIDDWDELTAAGETYVMKNQTLENWSKEFEKLYKTIDKDEKLCFIGHSLGCIFALHMVEKFNIQLDSAIFVSPFLDKLNGKWQIDLANSSFYKTDFDFEKLKKQIPTSYVLYSDNDPYVKKQHADLFGSVLGSSVIFVRQAQHFSGSVNMNEFPLVFDLACTRLDLSMYQGYLKHRIETDATDKVIMKEFKSVTFSPEDVTDEGVFHFRNLQKSGFCTYLSSFEFWDTTDKYYEDGRKAAQRVKDFTRVFVIENPKHLERQGLLSVMEKDMEAGIKVRLCWADDIKSQVPYLDFGIWDEDYLCIVKYDESNKSQATEVELNSKEEEMTAALEWKKIILAKSVLVTNLQKDIKKFLISKL
jgi:predicted alpha/beta hydrolase family esterase